MPHQCLNCGKIFEEGSSQLLKGCPDCSGNRFFFTKEPLDEKQRNEIKKDVKKDIDKKIIEMLGGENSDIVDKKGKWVNVKPKELRKAMQKHISDKKDMDDKNGEITIIDDEKRQKILDELKTNSKEDERPETIDIKKPGEYKIDLKGLLDEEPIIIQKDGTYTIHLPSLFKMINKE